MAWITDRMAEKLASRLALEAYRGNAPALAEAVDHLTRGLRGLRELGLPRADLLDLTGGALDAISNLNGRMEREMDDHRQHADPVDVSELRELHDLVKGDRT